MMYYFTQFFCWMKKDFDRTIDNMLKEKRNKAKMAKTKSNMIMMMRMIKKNGLS